MNEPTTHDQSPAADSPSARASSAGTSRNTKRAMQATTEYVSRLLAASLLTIWGVLNVIINVRGFSTPAENGEPYDVWWISGLLFLLTSVLPLLIGLTLFRKLLR